MKMLNAVKTERCAIDSINSYLKRNDIPFGRLNSSKCHCKCGETESVVYEYDGIKIEVAVCNKCGNDSMFDRLNISKTNN